MYRNSGDTSGPVRSMKLPANSLDQPTVKLWGQFIKNSERSGRFHPKGDVLVLDGIPRHLPALLRVEKLLKKARKAKLLPKAKPSRRLGKSAVARELFELAAYAQSRGWTAEELLLDETRKRECLLRQREKQRG